jgi:hypothetical protein
MSKLYKETPISEPPKVAGDYMLLKNGEYYSRNMWDKEVMVAQLLQQQDSTGWIIHHSDKINSVLGAAMRFLNQEQLIVLRDCLIERTPKIIPEGNVLTDEELEAVWDAALNRAYEEEEYHREKRDGELFTHPDKDTYLNQLKNKV